jgi:hypothetical protein
MCLTVRFRALWLDRAPAEIVRCLGPVPLQWAQSIAERCYQSMHALVLYSTKGFELLHLRVQVHELRVRIVEYMAMGLRRLFGKLGVPSILHSVCRTVEEEEVGVVAAFDSLAAYSAALEALGDKYAHLVAHQTLHGDQYACCSRYMGLTLRNRTAIRKAGLKLFLEFTRLSAHGVCIQMNECVVEALEAACHTVVKVLHVRGAPVAWDRDTGKQLLAHFLSDVTRRFFAETCCCAPQDPCMALPLRARFDASCVSCARGTVLLPVHVFLKFDHDARLLHMAARRPTLLIAQLGKDALGHVLKHYLRLLAHNGADFQRLSYLLI